MHVSLRLLAFAMLFIACAPRAHTHPVANIETAKAPAPAVHQAAPAAPAVTANPEDGSRKTAHYAALLAQQSPELATKNREDADFLEAQSALPASTKFLMAMQLDAVANHPGGVRYYAGLARKHGASEAQILEALRIVWMFAGRPAMVTGAEALR